MIILYIGSEVVLVRCWFGVGVGVGVGFVILGGEKVSMMLDFEHSSFDNKRSSLLPSKIADVAGNSLGLSCLKKPFNF